MNRSINNSLSEKELKYGFDHIANIKIEKRIVEVSEYESKEELIIQYTQLDIEK
ncbi:hypothetical protein [Gemelliphila palaticanis]|uniref:Uncharacterized protein n=1 Tax=Gemelliphila palaticanis TaxID=81950 RepID=A0ABX2SZ19_9BACL|nr:hypothetical protein [Gemella palaticanis]MBF0715682.1 hypothetical protein [Gemella palaticanis]NYS47612.1 hypothetical protein [Gemella palaticanis]